MPRMPYPYTQHRGLKEHPGSILVLAAAAEGRMLATGGSQGTRLFDTSRDGMTQIRRPSTVGTRGATCTLLWARPMGASGDVLFSGSQNGFFFCWQQHEEEFEEVFSVQIAHPAEITGLAYDHANNRLALCSRNDYIQSWAVTKDAASDAWTAVNVFSKQYSRLMPKAIVFADFGNARERDLYVFGLHNNGPVCTLQGDTGDIKVQWAVGSTIGDAVINWKDGVFVLDDPFSGAALFRLADRAKLHTFETPRERPNEARPRHVRFGDNGSVVVIGSDHGKVYVFETRSGRRLQTLDLVSTEWIQTLATAEADGVSIIFTARTSALDAREEIFVWKRARVGPGRVEWIIHTLIVAGCIIFLYQNLLSPDRLTEVVRWGLDTAGTVNVPFLDGYEPKTTAERIAASEVNKETTALITANEGNRVRVITTNSVAAEEDMDLGAFERAFPHEDHLAEGAWERARAMFPVEGERLEALVRKVDAHVARARAERAKA